ncbi:hypothetical protein ACIF85_26095 [Streptomyces sp. NPDC086033]|jgi:hypothetical protein|uniref:hypothetical protein n=1 Tax=unclassified Streptomyces TaxID=2593676 RepID=UPI000851D96D|nr:hypothetical protein [Streptomyces sp. LUP47B]
MARDEHLIELYLAGRRIASGLRIARPFALTTAHALGPDVLTTKPLLHLRDGTPAHILWGNTPSDLALLRLELNGTTGPLATTAFGEAHEGQSWRATVSVDPKPLTGSVVEPEAVYHDSPHLTVTALRLRCERVLRDPAAYAGSPIEETRQDPPVVLGLLVKPRDASPRESDEAFAISVTEALRLFNDVTGGKKAEKRTRANQVLHDRGYGSVRPRWTRTEPNRRARRPSEGN